MRSRDVPLMGRRVAAMTVDAFCDRLLGACARREGPPLRVGYLNAHTSNLAARDRRLAEAFDRFELVYADGMAVVWATRVLGRAVPERVNAGDFLPRVLWGAAARGIRVGLLGGTHEVASGCARRLRALVPGLEVAYAGTGHFATGGAEERAIIETIREARVDLLLVGMGSPRQETWALRHAEAAGVRVAWCVGALFELYSGSRRRAPLAMRRVGLEWAWRLALEPRRLASRYLLGNAVFAARVAMARLRGD